MQNWSQNRIVYSIRIMIRLKAQSVLMIEIRPKTIVYSTKIKIRQKRTMYCSRMNIIPKTTVYSARMKIRPKT